MEKKREKALAKKAQGGKKKKDDKAAVTVAAKIKMKDSDMYKKADPILFATQNFDSFDISSLYENKKGVFTADGKPLLMTGPLLIDTIEDNIRFRKKFSKMIEKCMLMHRITDLLPTFISRIKMSVIYHQGNEMDERSVYYGNEIGSKRCLEPPMIDFHFPNHVPNLCQFTLVCVGQDVDNPKEQFVHWIVSNINPKSDNKISSGKTFVDYAPPTPTLHGGLHRYVFILCSQEERDIVINEQYDTVEKRNTFNLLNFLKTYQLTEKSINFFHSKWHASVPGPHTRLDLSFLGPPVKNRTRLYSKKNPVPKLQRKDMVAVNNE